MLVKGDSYVINLPQIKDNDLREVVYQLNTILRKLEDRLDEMEAIRGSQYFNTARWELDYVGGE